MASAGKILVNGKEMTEKDITTDTSKPCGVTWALFKNGKWTYSKNYPEATKIENLKKTTIYEN